MAISTGYTFGSALCKALGLDPEYVTDLRLNVSADEIVTVDVRMAVDCNEEFLEVFTKYELSEIPAVPWVASDGCSTYDYRRQH